MSVVRKQRAATLLALVCIVVTTACASTGGTPRPFPNPGPPPKPASPIAPNIDEGLPSVGHDRLIETALDLRGIPYKNGGTDPTGFDCSGFTQYVFAQYGLSLPREVREQFGVGQAVDRTELEPGDLIFFTTTGPGASHVGIAVGGDAFVHAPSSSGVVRVERLGSSYWATRFVGGRRVLRD
jgi:hypothetical protein